LKNKEIGTVGESLAAYFLRALGYEILEAHFITKFGEIDLIVRKGDFVYLIEVKTRKNEAFGDIYETFTKWQLERVSMGGRYFALRNNIPEECLKIACIGIKLNEFGGVSDIELIKDISLD